MPFVSVNVTTDESAIEDLKRLGVVRVPIVSRGDQWVDGQAIEDLASFVGIDWVHQLLSPQDLAVRVKTVLAAAQRFAAQLPEDKLFANIPMVRPRERTYISLAAHIGLLIDCLPKLMEDGERLEFEHLDAGAPAHVRTRADLLALLAGIQRRFDAWWARDGQRTDYSARADVYYGDQTVHEFFERTAWHSAQHTRQLQAAVEALGIAPDRRLTAADLAGLPLPKEVFDSQ